MNLDERAQFKAEMLDPDPPVMLVGDVRALKVKVDAVIAAYEAFVATQDTLSGQVAAVAMRYGWGHEDGGLKG